MLVGTLMVTMTTVSFYMITAYTPTFGNAVLHLASMDSLIVTLCVGASNLFWLPVMGALSDRIGRRPLLFACTVLHALTAYPAMLWLVREPSFTRLLTVELWLSFIFGSYNGAMVVFLDRDHAGRRTNLGVCAGLQPGHRNLWRLYARGQHLLDPRHRKSRDSRFVAVVCRSVWTRRVAVGQTSGRPG